MQFKDYYNVLGVPRDADQDAVKRAYRRLARKFHPDVSKEPEAKQRFQEVGEAYEVLKDPQKRAAYDRFGENWKAGQDFQPPPDWEREFDFGGGGFTGTSGFSDFFEALFGRHQAGGHQRRGARFRMRGNDHRVRIQVNLEDAYRGAQRTINLEAPEVDKDGAVRTRTKTLNVKVPKGVVDGQRIRLAGQGAAGAGGGEPGDLYLEIGFAPHPRFRADKRDIYLDLPVTPWEAALGETIKVPTLGGSVELKIPKNSQSGHKLRLKGRGLPGNPPGDQFVVLRIVVPRADSAEAQALYRKMAEKMPMEPRSERKV